MSGFVATNSDGMTVRAVGLNSRDGLIGIGIDVFDDEGRSVTTEIAASLNRDQAIELAAFLLECAARMGWAKSA